VDKQKVMARRRWSYNRTLLILSDFDGRLALSQMDFTVSPIWIQIHNMPFGCMNREVDFQIGSTLGKVEDVAVAEDDIGWGQCTCMSGWPLISINRWNKAGLS
jgi:hypothetical protein